MVPTASFTRFLYNGRCGVSTDENGLYYMRQRYYNVDIRRFINQDIITGNLANSQSLNRYAYVQGNPVKYTDPFGLSPEDGGNKGGNFWHSLLCFVGMIPGPIGAVANAVDAGIYLSEGNYAMAAMCALDAVIPAAGAVGKALAGTCKYARIGREIATGAKVANTVFNLSRGMYNADRAVGSFCERHKDDLFTDKFRWTKADTADLASFGLSSLTCFISGKSLAKDIDDFMAASTDLATLGSSVGCFVAGTIVKTEEGDKAIEEIEAGDKVLSYEATTGRFAYKEVVEVIAHDGVTELAHVTIGGETIDSTTNHPYFVVGYGYVDAGNLIEGDTVLLANGKEAKVEKVEIEFLIEPVTVYNFEVKDWHCYFVGEAGVLVHNANIRKCKNINNVGKGGEVKRDLQTGIGYDAGDSPVRIEGEWTINDMKQGLLGHAPRGLGNPDIHHGGQMPGGAHHEIIPSQHRNNSALHPNLYNQGVTAEMRLEEKQLHWWYRAREQGADLLLPGWIYDNK